MASELVIWIVN